MIESKSVQKLSNLSKYRNVHANHFLDREGFCRGCQRERFQG